ncbi:MAG TPA: molybdopterin-dependent oxidoreductase [Ktedonobacterales bacterium]|nr:molybdopterin-dependent oxidoreductase [Ktedonobacterales bacterium]
MSDECLQAAADDERDEPSARNEGAGQATHRARVPDAIIGLAAAGSSVLFQGLLHLAAPNAPFAPFSLAEFTIRHLPGELATGAIELLGHWALRLTGLGAILVALGVGVVLRRRSPHALALAALVVTLGAAALDPTHPDILASLAAALVGGVGALVAAAPLREWRSGGGAQFDAGRRQLLAAGIWSLGVAVLGGGAFWRVVHPLASATVTADLPFNVALDPTFEAVPGLSALVTARADHYEVEIDLEPPAVSDQGWQLRVHGGVSHPLALSLGSLREMPTVERLINMSCISNTIGGPLVGDSLWTGVSLSALLNWAAPTLGAHTLIARGADGYFDAMPLDVARLPDVLVAIAMNGELLPREHGFPARLLIPGRYGFKSVKWLEELVIVTTSPMGYWEQRGWDGAGVIRTESRFDVPVDHSKVSSPFVAAGVAWAGTRGIARVEVSPDDGRSWHAAELETMADVPSWRRWRIALDLAPGVHPLSVRATDGIGRLQDAIYRTPHPSGTSGYHRIVVTVAS